MIFVESPSFDPYFNLALEEVLFTRSDGSEPVFILWQNLNTIVIGKYQNTLEEINSEYVEEQGIKVARRLSGGGAVYHDSGNLNYTFVVKQDEAFDFNFKHFVLPVVEALKSVGVNAEFTGRNDILIDGRKFSGNSQYVKQGKILHHGCIMLDSNLLNVSNALKVNAAKFESKSTKSVRSRVTCINEHLEKKLTMDEFKSLLKTEVFRDNDIKAYALTEEDLAEIEKLRNEKYATWEWNYGRSPEYKVKREKKFACGLVTCYLDVEQGSIKSIAINGDFFGTDDITELERALSGVSLNSNLGEIAEVREIDRYIHGMNSQDFVNLILNG